MRILTVAAFAMGLVLKSRTAARAAYQAAHHTVLVRGVKQLGARRFGACEGRGGRDGQRLGVERAVVQQQFGDLHVEGPVVLLPRACSPQMLQCRSEEHTSELQSLMR